MKTRPLVLAALTGLAAIVSCEFGVLAERVASAGKNLSVHLRSGRVESATALAAKAVARSLLRCPAKS